MDVILIPGFWLDASSWDEVAPIIRAAGHTVHALTLPGLESAEADRSGIRLQDHVDAVVAEIDRIDAPVALVGHSGGGAMAHAAADARPDQVARVVYVDSLPLGDGGVINDELPVVNGEVPLPDWSVFGDEDLVDLTDELRASLRAKAIPEPQHVTSDRLTLHNERRYDVPATVITCEFSSDQLREFMKPEHPWSDYVRELSLLRDFELVDLPTGHWPQFTRPADLGAAIVAAVR